MWCHDPFLECLKSSGYSVVRTPRADLAPLQLLLRSGRDLERLGAIESVLVPGRRAALPVVMRDQAAPGISGQRTGSLDAGTGLTFLMTFLAALTGGPVALEAAYGRAGRVSFTFDEVMEDAVALLDLDAYLSGAHVAGRAARVTRLLDADDLYVTTAVVKSRSFSLEAADEDGAEVRVDVPLVQQLVGGRVTVTQAGAGCRRLTYRGRIPLGFGFRAVRLFYDDGRYSAFRPLPPGEAALSRQAAAPDWLAPEQGFARMRQAESTRG